LGFEAQPNLQGEIPLHTNTQGNLQASLPIKEGAITTLTATATDIGNDPLTYRWYINGATTAIEGRSIDYTFSDNGNYPVKLEVLDNHGGITTQTVNVTVNNVAPTIASVTAPNNLKEGSLAQFSATATDPGILDTLTYSWNFGDNTNPVVGQNVNHTFADNGTYNVVLNVTDKDGAVTSQITSIKVDNVASIVNLSAPTTNLNQAGGGVGFRASTQPTVLLILN
jgi:PKD repeat protein